MSSEGCFSPVLRGLSSFCWPPTSASTSKPASLRILHVNDVYKPERFAKFRSLAKQCRGPNVSKVVLPGDLLGGSLFAATHRGESVVDVLNALEVDYCVLGNHEFDYGSDRTRELMDKSKFPWLGSNVREPTGKIFHSTMDTDIFEVPLGRMGTVKVGVFGVCTMATPQLSFPGPGVVFESAMDHAKRCVGSLKQEGCEVILSFSHLSLLQDKELATIDGINAILGGHDHDPYLLVHQGTLIVKCGQNADHLGVLDFALDRSSPKASLDVEYSFQLLSTRSVQADPEVVAVAACWQDGNADGAILCRVGDVALSTRTQELRTKENAFGCLVADAIRWSYSSEGCEVAVQNGGFIRQDSMYAAHTAITETDVREEMPFPKRPILLRLCGADLRQALEEMLASTPAAAGSFPHLSKGISVEFSPHAPKQKISSIRIGDEDLQPSKDYLVAISEFYANSGGDGVTSFTRGVQVACHEKLIRDVVVDYFGFRGTVSGDLPGRLVAV